MSPIQECWVTELQSMITNPDVLFEQLQLPTALLPKAKQVAKLFPLRLTPSFLSRIAKNDLNDPLLKQVLPVTLEESVNDNFSDDPLKESQYNPVPGILHKYKNRALITITGACAIHCRYCFRRHFPYQSNTPGKKLEAILAYLQNDQSIQEVILSGGDPLMVKDNYLAHLLNQLSGMIHIKTIRLHTRLPIVLPSRITTQLIHVLSNNVFKIVCVIHCNHAQEIDDQVSHALKKLHMAGATLLNQSVLLKGVNDTVSTLTQLSHRLFENHVIPYYLHMLDKVQGASHFEVTREDARNLYYALRAELPGYLVPLLVEEKPGALSKLPVM